MNRNTNRVTAFLAVFLALLIMPVAAMLSACSFTSGGDRTTSQSVHTDLLAHLADAQDAQTQALALWDRLIDGESVSCEVLIAAPPLVALSSAERRVHPQAAAVQDAINTAIQSLHTSADLWDNECVQLRESVALTTARDGRVAALNASESLSMAAALLASWE